MDERRSKSDERRRDENDVLEIAFAVLSKMELPYDPSKLRGADPQAITEMKLAQGHLLISLVSHFGYERHKMQAHAQGIVIDADQQLDEVIQFQGQLAAAYQRCGLAQGPASAGELAERFSKAVGAELQRQYGDIGPPGRAG